MENNSVYLEKYMEIFHLLTLFERNISMKLPQTLSLISKCWLNAEQRVCKLISTKYHAHNEVTITHLLYGEVKEEFDKINENGTFARVFSKDLFAQFKDRKLADEVSRLSKGIIARISYHEPQMEIISGADFGLAVVRPFFEKIREDRLKYTMQRQGLLCQAKRQQFNGKLGQLTLHQMEVIPKHIAYFALLLYLYRYSDRERKNLLPFAWWHESTCDIDDIIDFLNNFDAEETVSSVDLIHSLGEGNIGTDDQDIINSIICPEELPYILVEITWRDGFPPKPPSGPRSGLSFETKNFENNLNTQKLVHRIIHHRRVQHVKTKTK